MKYIINTYINGKIDDSIEKDNDYDWEWLEHYSEKVDDLVYNGWNRVKSSYGGDIEYEVLFNESRMESICYSYEKITLLDLIDSVNQAIRAGAIYVSQNGDRYHFGVSKQSGKTIVYLRHDIGWMKWKDIDNPTQEMIDSLGLKRLQINSKK